MDHMQFKANQTAAVYVANGLDPRTQEAFELHLMSCPDCVEDVEAWRAIKNHMPAQESVSVAPAPVVRRVPAHAWRLAAAVAFATFVGGMGGWFVRSAQDPQIDAAQTVFFNLPPAARAFDDCTALPLAPQTRVVVVRVPAVPSDHRVVALGSDGNELRSRGYDVQRQPDGSWIVRLDSTLVERRAIRIETRATDGSGAPMGCVMGQSAPVR